MMVPNLAICFLAYLQLSASQPVEIYTSPEQYKLPLMQNASPQDINMLGVQTAGEINVDENEDIDTLIEKVKEVTSRYKKDVDGTIADVQKILEDDFSLPRLTRGEIVEILDNLTKADIEELRRQGTKTRKDYQRALMLVMPYTSKDSRYNVEELYTKPPVTHIVGAHNIKPTPKMNIEILNDTTMSTSTEAPRMDESTLRSTSPVKTEKTEPVEYDITTMRPKKPFNFHKPTKPDFVSSTHRPLYSKPTRHSNHKYQEENSFQPSNQGFRVVSPPSFATKPAAESWEIKQTKPVAEAWEIKQTKPIVESWEVKQNNDWDVKPTPIRKKPSRQQSSVYKAPLSSTSRPRYRSTSPSTTTASPIFDMVPEDMKDLVKNIQLVDPVKKNKYSSQYVASETSFQPMQPTTENIDEILGMIGGSPTTKMPDLTGVADTLTPEMKELLLSFGLIEDPNKSTTELPQSPLEPETVDIKPVSYTQFKPLPDTAPSRDDMYDFLSSFGLIGSSRSAKKIKPTKEYEPPKQLSEVPHIDMEMIPESMHGVLEDIGLAPSNRRGKRIEIDETQNEKTHVFNPVESSLSSGELKKLNQLMETLVRLEKLNRTVTEEDFRDIDLENIAEITKILGSNSDKVIPLDSQSAPNPLDFDLSVEKNEVKRQETTTKKEETSSTTEESRNPSISALEESFGGSVTTKAEDATLPPPRKTGFYYLVDWNTFLEVGEEGKNRVNIRFSPRAGDPSRFLKVTVP